MRKNNTLYSEKLRIKGVESEFFGILGTFHGQDDLINSLLRESEDIPDDLEYMYSNQPISVKDIEKLRQDLYNERCVYAKRYDMNFWDLKIDKVGI